MSTAATFEPCIGQVQEEPQGHNIMAKRLLDIHALQGELTSSPYSHDVLELAMATATSIQVSIQDDTALVWLMIVGNPGSDKTQTVLQLKHTLNAFYLDTITENSWLTAYVDPKTNKPAESLLPKLNGQCLIVKDLTTMFGMKDDRVREILGDIQSIYDVEYRKATGTLSVLEAKSLFSLLACITPAALVKHRHYLSQIGSRFLFYRVLALTDEEREEAFALQWGMQGRKGKREELQYLIKDHVRHLLTSGIMLQPEGPAQRKRVQELATLVARGRGIVSPGLEEPQIEEPIRAMLQLRNLGLALARVHGRPSMSEHELELLHRVALSTIPERRARLLVLFPRYQEGLTVTACAAEIGQDDETARLLLNELAELKIVEKQTEGKKAVYYPVPALMDALLKPIAPPEHVRDLA